MALILKNITKSFNGDNVLNNFNATFNENSITCIMGESGAGKTTLINIIMGFVKQDSGDIFGIENKKFSVVFQEDRLCEDFDAMTNIRLVCDKNLKDEYIIEVLKDLGMKEYKNKKVSLLSGGMKRRVAIARALCADSDIVIMDEPFKGLDQDLYLNTIRYVKEKLSGKIAIIITHIKEECELLKSEIITL